MMIYRAIIFDLDGTLADTLMDLGNAVNGALEDFGLSGHRIEAYRQMIGDGTARLIERALPAEKQDLRDEVLATAQRYYNRNCLEKCRLYDGVAETVMKLRDQGIRLAVLTNKDQYPAKRIIEHFFGLELFEYIIGVTGDGPVKPDGKATKQLVESMGLEPNDFLFVGDSGVDADTAAAAEIQFVGVSWGFRGRGELVKHNADIIIDMPEELLNLLA